MSYIPLNIAELVGDLQVHQTTVSRILQTPESSNLPKKTDVPVCPGLIHDFKLVQDWFIPTGYAGHERTYCEVCVKNYGLSGKYSKKLSIRNNGCNCESYLMVSGIDNGIFNVSIWSSDLRTLYRSENNTVCIPSGKFSVLITYNIKKFKKVKRLFKATVKMGDIILYKSPLTRENVLGQNIIHFINSHSSKETDKYIKFMSALDDTEKVISDSIITVSIDVFEIIESQFSTVTNKDLGTLEYKDGKLYQDVKYRIADRLEQQQEYINPTINVGIKKFTKKPIEFTFNLVSMLPENDPTFNTSSISTLKIISNAFKKNLKKMDDEEQIANILEHKRYSFTNHLTALYTNISEEIDTISEKIANIPDELNDMLECVLSSDEEDYMSEVPRAGTGNL
uniref:Uncharacterized protein n=1 Tax=viral metagenome TaxID=1070528 RepID=A0A6C0J435_9ZZZZ